MFKLNPKDQSAKASVLQEIMDMMSDSHGSDLKALADGKKKPVASMTIAEMKPEGSPDEESTESPDDEASEDDGHGNLSPEEQDMLERLLKKSGGR